MFPHESACFGAQLGDGKPWGLVEVERGGIDVAQARVELVPLFRRQPSALDLVACEFCHVAYQTFYELYVCHLKREYGHGGGIVHGHVLGHRKDEGRLSHCRAGGDYYEV